MSDFYTAHIIVPKAALLVYMRHAAIPRDFPVSVNLLQCPLTVHLRRDRACRVTQILPACTSDRTENNYWFVAMSARGVPSFRCVARVR